MQKSKTKKLQKRRARQRALAKARNIRQNNVKSNTIKSEKKRKRFAQVFANFVNTVTGKKDEDGEQ